MSVNLLISFVSTDDLHGLFPTEVRGDFLQEGRAEGRGGEWRGGEGRGEEVEDMD